MGREEKKLQPEWYPPTHVPVLLPPVEPLAETTEGPKLFHPRVITFSISPQLLPDLTPLQGRGVLRIKEMVPEQQLSQKSAGTQDLTLRANVKVKHRGVHI